MYLLETSAILGRPELYVAAGITVVAGFIRGFLGFGSGMLMAPVFAILYTPLEAVVMVILLDLPATALLLPSVHRLIEWRFVVPMSLAAAVCMPPGTWALMTVDKALMTRGIALVVLVFVLLLMTGWRYGGPKRLAVTLGVGMLSGVLIASTSLGNPPVMLYLLSGSDAAATNRANFTGYFALTLVTLLGMMLLREVVALNAALRAALLFPLFAAGTWMGARYFSRSNERLYRRLAFGLMLCVAVFGLLR
jgi:uncharacterized membrane protein YfcA